ncbi:MAG: hypothetical protein HPY64_00075 [Anaerolineae bacterium]|nr:hypothetical protein [Anaerolineae bacterium]
MSDLHDHEAIPPEDAAVIPSLPESPADQPPVDSSTSELVTTTADESQLAGREIPELVRRPAHRPAERPPRGLHTTLAGILLIALGVILVWPVLTGGYILVPNVIAVIAITGWALSLLAYWHHTGRQARGALFLALMLLFWVGTTAIAYAQGALDSRLWPLYVAVLGLAILLTYVGDRQRESRLATPGIILLLAGLIGLLITYDIIPPAILATISGAWPWVVVVLILALLPLAFQRAPRRRS